MLIVFGRSYRGRYDKIIDPFHGHYGSPLIAGLETVFKIARREITVIADCGTGTGYATRVAGGCFPKAIFLGLDLLEDMIRQAQNNCRGIPAIIHHLRGDSFALPLADSSVDMVMAMNTLPCFAEFARVCRPGGVILYVDSSAGWIVNLAVRLIGL